MLCIRNHLLLLSIFRDVHWKKNYQTDNGNNRHSHWECTTWGRPQATKRANKRWNKIMWKSIIRRTEMAHQLVKFCSVIIYNKSTSHQTIQRKYKPMIKLKTNEMNRIEFINNFFFSVHSFVCNYLEQRKPMFNYILFAGSTCRTCGMSDPLKRA